MSDPDRPEPGEPEPFLRTPFNEERATLSPDGRWVAYTSDELGTSEVYVQSFLGSTPGRGGRWQISTAGGSLANWSRNGRELFYESDSRIMVTEYTVKGDSFVAGKPRVWSPQQLFASGFANYDVAPDGKRLAIFPRPDAAESEPSRVAFLLNFFDEVRRRLPRK